MLRGSWSSTLTPGVSLICMLLAVTPHSPLSHCSQKSRVLNELKACSCILEPILSHWWALRTPPSWQNGRMWLVLWTEPSNPALAATETSRFGSWKEKTSQCSEHEDENLPSVAGLVTWVWRGACLQRSVMILFNLTNKASLKIRVWS